VTHRSKNTENFTKTWSKTSATASSGAQGRKEQRMASGASEGRAAKRAKTGAREGAKGQQREWRAS